MKRLLILLSMLVLAWDASAQRFAQSGASAKELTPEGWNINEICVRLFGRSDFGNGESYELVRR